MFQNGVTMQIFEIYMTMRERCPLSTALSTKTTWLLITRALGI